MIRHRLLISFLSGFIFFTLAGATENVLPAGVSIHQLDNGLRVLLVENPALPMVGVNVVVKVGSAYESFATSGMSHMLEHLLFNGTTTRTQKQLYDDVDRIGGYNNANTADYYTNFMMVVPAEHIREGMEIQADMLFHSTLPKNKFEKEKGIVLEEISKTLADPNAQLERNANGLLYRGHALSLPTLGTYATIEHMGRDAVQAFYKNNYVPNNMLMSVIGNFNSAEMLRAIREIYGKAAPGLVRHQSSAEWATGFEVPVSVPEKAPLYFRFYDGKTAHLQFFYPLKTDNDPAFFNLFDVALEKNQQGLEDKLKKKFPNSIQRVDLFSHNSPLKRFLEVNLTLSRAKLPDGIEDAVNQAISGMHFKLSAERVTAEVAKTRTAFLKNIEKPHMFGIFNAYTFAVKGIEGVLDSYSSGPLMRAAKKLENFKIHATPLRLLQEPAANDDVRAESNKLVQKVFHNPQSNSSLIVVQNPASKLLAIHYLFKHKAALEQKYGKNAAALLQDCFGQRLKSAPYSAQSARFGLSVKVNDNPYFPMDNIYLDPDFGYIRVEALADDVPGVIKFLNSVMRDFKPTRDEFNKARKKFRRIAAMNAGGDAAKKLFKRIYKNLIFNTVPQAAPKPDYQTLLQFASDYFQAGNSIISVVSPLEAQQINRLFSDYTAAGKAGAWPVFRQDLKMPSKDVHIDSAGHGSRAYLFYGFVQKIDPADAPALQALSLILSDKIIFDIREKQGLAYHMSAGVSTRGDKALFYINQGTRPENVQKLLPQYPGFFKMDMLKDLTEATLQKSLNMYLGRMMFRRLSSINRAYYLAHSLYFDNNVNYDHDFLQALKNIKKADVLRVAKKYMHALHPVSVTVH